MHSLGDEQEENGEDLKERRTEDKCTYSVYDLITGSELPWLVEVQKVVTLAD